MNGNRINYIKCLLNCALSSMDRASGFGPEGWGFDSLRAYHISALKLLRFFEKRQFQGFFNCFHINICKKKEQPEAALFNYISLI